MGGLDQGNERHQLGTPTSSLLAWAEILRDRNAAPDIIDEMEKDIRRLEKITERFSKVGSEPLMQPVDLSDLIVRTVDYIRTRVSRKMWCFSPRCAGVFPHGSGQQFPSGMGAGKSDEECTVDALEEGEKEQLLCGRGPFG
jgi:signal transduction histidine kinase